MSLQRFILFWIVTVLLCISINLCLWLALNEESIVMVSIMAISIFAFLSIIVYFVGEYMLNTANKQLYLGVVLGNMGFKMLMSVAIMLIVRAKLGSVSKTAFLSFLIIYVAFTVFETYFMLKQSDRKK